MAGGEHASERGPGTPLSELTRIRETREREAEETEKRVLEAVLVACGERGYRAVSVQDVIDRYGGNRVHFYRCFASKADCYRAAYEWAAERLCGIVLEAAETAPGWRGGLRAALDELARFATAEPALARGLLIEVHVAGGPALAARRGHFERLARAIDRGRGEAGPDLAPPPGTARFMAGAIESSLACALASGEPQAFAAAVPELTHMVVATYLGEDAAGAELAAATAA